MNTLIAGDDDKGWLKDFVELLLRGKQCIEDAAKLLVGKLDEGLDAYALIEALPDKPASMRFVRNLEKLGRGQMDPRLLMDDSPVLRLAQHLPYSQQKKLLEEKVDLVVETPEGTDVLKVDLHALDMKHARQVIARDHIATQGEQKAYLAAEKSKARAKSPAGSDGHAWRVLRGGKVEFTRGCVLTVKELTMIIAQAQR